MPGIDPLLASLDKFQVLLPQDEFSKLLAELDKPLHGGMRINPFKSRKGDLEDWKKRYGWEYRAVPFCPEGYQLISRQVNPGITLEHRMGAFYLQDAASMLPAEMFDFPPGSHPLIMDLAASPGGKTTHLISRTGDMGLMIANDSSRGRIPALRMVLQNWGAINHAITCFPGEWFGTLFTDQFDAVLLDAPCSMEGLRATDAHPLRSITEKERGALAKRQVMLLSSALQAVCPGGQVVYSTCTLAPEEDEAVLDAILKKYPDRVQIDELDSRFGFSAPGLYSDSHDQFAKAVRNAFRLWPHLFGTAGFFAARLTKKDSLPSEEKNIPRSISSPTPREFLSTGDEQRILDNIQKTIGFDLTKILETCKQRLRRTGRQVFLHPVRLDDHFSGLRVEFSGMQLGEFAADRFELSHEFCSRFYQSFSSGWVTLPGDLLPAWLRGEDIAKSVFSPLPFSGIILLRDEDGRFIGRGRVTPEKVKNLLPRRMVH